jgi:spore maturation protein CgeB
MRVLLAGNFQIRRYGEVRILSDRKLYYGLVRNGHQVLDFSDRDIAAFNAPFRLRDFGRGAANRRFLETCRKFRPDLIMVNHCDIITNESLLETRQLNPDIRIAYRNVDALFVKSNVRRLLDRLDCVDHVFVTTAGDPLEQFRGGAASVSFVPNPVDVSIETEDNSQRTSAELDVDLLFCGNGSPGPDCPRFLYVQHLKRHLPESCRFETYGSMGRPPVWGYEYEQLLSTTRMALNLNREECGNLYTSSRVAQLMGNGILTFIHRDSDLEQLFGKDRAAYFDSEDELLETVLHFQNNDEERRRVASAGREYSFEHFSSDAISQFMVEKTMQLPMSREYVWDNDALLNGTEQNAA